MTYINYMSDLTYFYFAGGVTEFFCLRSSQLASLYLYQVIFWISIRTLQNIYAEPIFNPQVVAHILNRKEEIYHINCIGATECQNRNIWTTRCKYKPQRTFITDIVVPTFISVSLGIHHSEPANNQHKSIHHIIVFFWHL